MMENKAHECPGYDEKRYVRFLDSQRAGFAAVVCLREMPEGDGWITLPEEAATKAAEAEAAKQAAAAGYEQPPTVRRLDSCHVGVYIADSLGAKA